MREYDRYSTTEQLTRVLYEPIDLGAACRGAGTLRAGEGGAGLFSF
jgi:hypothetical protein